MVRIITDSTSDLSAAYAEEHNLKLVPLSVHFGAESFRDGLDLTNREFYAKLSQAETLPTTAQVNPEEFQSLFQAAIDAGDQVLGIFLSSDLSGTYQSACIARDMVEGGEIHLIDSRSVTFGLGLLVDRALTLRQEGATGGEIAAAIRDLVGRLRLYAVVDTLKYLKMGGRISPATAMVGGLLGITPIVSVQNGLVEAVGKARGRKAAFRWMEERLQEEQPDLSLPVAFGHTDAPDAMEECRSFFAPALAGAKTLTGEIGSVVGTHAGPGATGFAYFSKN
ncbi:MAG: DegV family protein [Pseudoflavonifractor sp.]